MIDVIENIVVSQITHYFDDFPASFRKYLVNRLKWERLGLANGKIVVNSYFPPFPSKAFKSAVEAWRSIMSGVNVPEISTIAVTNRCPYNCDYCSVRDKTIHDLPRSLLVKIIQSLQEMGTYNVSLTGGEPLLRDDIEDIINSVDSRSIVKLFSTGYTLTKERANALKKAGLYSINISLHNSDPRKHDAGSRFEGAFEIALNAIQNSKAASLVTCVATIATKERIISGELFHFLKFMKELGVDEVTVFEPIPVGRLAFCDNAILDEDERVILKRLHKNANEKYKSDYPRVFAFPYLESSEYMGCGAGSTRLHVTALGEVLPCDFTHLSFGNITEEDIKMIWERMNKSFKKPCASCFALDNYKFLRELNCTLSDTMNSHLSSIDKYFIRGEVLPDFYQNLLES